MNPMQMLQGMRNPQQLLQQMMGNSSVTKNPMARNDIQMAQKGDSNGIEQMARNLCKEKGIDFDKSFSDFKNQFHF